jgi:hypothetical protein
VNYVRRPALVEEPGVSSDDRRIRPCREPSDQIVRDPIGKVLLFWIAAQVVERERGERRPTAEARSLRITHTRQRLVECFTPGLWKEKLYAVDVNGSGTVL